MGPRPRFGNLLVGEADLSGSGAEVDPGAPPARWRLTVARSPGQPLLLSDLLLVIPYRRAE
jgi:hypothetical protein